MQSATPQFETAVLTAFSDELQRYCDGARHARRAGARRAVLVISVVTAVPVPGLRARLEQHAGRVLGRELPGARLDGMFFAVNPAMSEPWYVIGIDDRVPAPHPGAGEVAPEPVWLLTLTLGGPHRYVFPLVVTADWIGVRRGRPAPDLRHEIALPDYLNAVPGGTLLQLRYLRGRVEMRRTEQRPEFTVSIDGITLEPWLPVVLGGGGRIGYANGTGRSELRYVLMERQ